MEEFENCVCSHMQKVNKKEPKKKKLTEKQIFDCKCKTNKETKKKPKNNTKKKK